MYRSPPKVALPHRYRGGEEEVLVSRKHKVLLSCFMCSYVTQSDPPAYDHTRQPHIPIGSNNEQTLFESCVIRHTIIRSYVIRHTIIRSYVIRHTIIRSYVIRQPRSKTPNLVVWHQAPPFRHHHRRRTHHFCRPPRPHRPLLPSLPFSSFSSSSFSSSSIRPSL